MLMATISSGQLSVSGVIQDALTGEPIIGGTIYVAGSSDGTITDIDGTYELNQVSSTDSLTISYVGYLTKTVAVNGRSVINVNLSVDNVQLDEVVVVGYGRQKKKLVSGAISQVKAEEIQATPVLRVEQALQGRTPGVQVTNISGQPGDEPTVRIRGIGTTGNSKPLYIVDGIPVGGIDYLNPGDIESIDVLKDAASAAIYGSRAANGVVLITTKGSNGGKMSVTYDTYYGVQNARKNLNMLGVEDYRLIMNEGARNAGLTEPFDLQEVPRNNTNWQDELFVSNAPMISHQLGVQGGGEKSSYAASLSYFTQEGIIGGPKSQFDRYTARVNSNHKVNSWLTFGNTLAYTHLIKRGIGVNQSFNGAYSSALNMDPLTPVFETRESELSQYPYNFEPVVTAADGGVYGISRFVNGEVVNPLALLETQNQETRKDQLVGSVFGTIEPIKNLKIKSNLGIDLAYVLDDSFRPLFFLNGAQLNDNKTTVNKGINRYYTWQWENTANYDFEVGDHSFGVLAGISALEFNTENLFGSNGNVPVDDPNNVYLDLATDTIWQAFGGAAHSALYSLFSRVNYSYKDKYSVTAILRRDGSSKFGPGNRFGTFPSVGVAWVVSDEDFLGNEGVLNFLKLRASWGINGNQEIGDYQFVSPLVNNRGYNGQIGVSPGFLANEDIGWEESTQIDVGADFGFFDNKLQGSLDYYQKSTDRLLERVAIPGHVGNDPPFQNVGSVENSGVELALSWRETKGKLSYTVGINGAYNSNEMTSIGNAEKVIPGAAWALAGAVTRSAEGLPIAYFWGFETDGLFQNEGDVFSHINSAGDPLQPLAVPGDVKFVDVNSDGVIDADDRTKIGNPTPDFTFGANVNVEYGNVDFSMFWQGTQGNDIFNGSQRQDLRYTNRTTAILDRWTGEGTSNSTPRYTWLDVNNNYRVSDLYIEDGSFVRLKNIQIGYTLPARLLKKLGADVWRFYVSAENLLTFTAYTGADPEIGSLSSFDIGIDRGIYPQPRIYRVGTSVTF